MNQTTLSGIYPYRTELHAHTEPASLCGHLLPEALVALYLSHGAHGMVITNHLNTVSQGERTAEQYAEDYLSDYYRAKAAAEGKDFHISLGVEIRFDAEGKNDYLIYGVEPEEVLPMIGALSLGIEAFYRRFKRADNLILQAHPFRDGMTPIDLSLLDGIETFNMHPGHNSRVGFAARCVKEHNLPVRTVGTDFHHKNRGHEAVSALRCAALPNDSFELAALLRSGEYVFEIGEDAIVLP